jgi:hypothetical protein
LLAQPDTEPHTDAEPAKDSHAITGVRVRLRRLQRLLQAFLDRHADPRGDWERRRVDEGW